MSEFFSYNPAILGFILDLSPLCLVKVKEQLVDAVKDIESDDKGYVYHPSDLKIKRNPGPVVASISNYEHPHDFDLVTGIRQVVYLMGMEDYDANKFVFSIVDDYDESNYYGIVQAMKLDLKEDYNCQFVFLNVKTRHIGLEDFVEIHPRCRYLYVENTDKLTEIILEIYKDYNVHNN